MKVIHFNEKGNKTIYNSLHQNGTLYIITEEYPGINIRKQLDFVALDHYNQVVSSMNEGYYKINIIISKLIHYEGYFYLKLKIMTQIKKQNIALFLNFQELSHPSLLRVLLSINK